MFALSKGVYRAAVVVAAKFCRRKSDPCSVRRCLSIAILWFYLPRAWYLASGAVVANKERKVQEGAVTASFHTEVARRAES